MEVGKEGGEQEAAHDALGGKSQPYHGLIYGPFHVLIYGPFYGLIYGPVYGLIYGQWGGCGARLLVHEAPHDALRRGPRGGERVKRAAAPHQRRRQLLPPPAAGAPPRPRSRPWHGLGQATPWHGPYVRRAWQGIPSSDSAHAMPWLDRTRSGVRLVWQRVRCVSVRPAMLSGAGGGGRRRGRRSGDGGWYAGL